ncbi:Phosphate starvation-inducible protein PsiF precursor [compost metagenome]
MTLCNKEASAKALKGDERNAFMSTCLKATPAAPVTQQEKMTLCNKEASAKTLKGDERNAFMSQCLKKKE